jgi:hypothetical protein
LIGGQSPEADKTPIEANEGEGDANQQEHQWKAYDNEYDRADHDQWARGVIYGTLRVVSYRVCPKAACAIFAGRRYEVSITDVGGDSGFEDDRLIANTERGGVAGDAALN